MVVDVLKARKKRNLKKKRNTLESIPGELLMEIVGRVASDSCQDLLNTKLSCKTLNKIGDDDSIFRRVSLDKFPVITPPKSMASFLHRCYKAGNSEAIYRLGIKHYFENKDMEFLWRAANLGTHVDAPGHMVADYFDAGFDVDTLDLDVLNGPALLVDVQDIRI